MQRRPVVTTGVYACLLHTLDHPLHTCQGPLDNFLFLYLILQVGTALPVVHDVSQLSAEEFQKLRAATRERLYVT